MGLDARGHGPDRRHARHHLRHSLFVLPQRDQPDTAAPIRRRGRASFDGGVRTAALGLACHFFIAFVITLIFFIAARRVPALVKQPLLIGALYGIGVYLVMNWVVIPLSKIGPRPFPATVVLVTGLLVHMFLIGAPIAFGARRAVTSA